MALICDTGGVYALYDADDQHHAAAQRRIVAKIEALRNDLAGDVKRLTNFTPEYRLRFGDYRVLFEVEEDRVVVYRVLHRKDAY